MRKSLVRVSVLMLVVGSMAFFAPSVGAGKGKVVFRDDFSEELWANYQDDNGGVVYAEGELQIYTNIVDSFAGILAPHAPVWGDQIVEVEWHPQDTATQFFIFCRGAAVPSQANGPLYEATITSGGAVRIRKFSPGTPEPEVLAGDGSEGSQPDLFEGPTQPVEARFECLERGDSTDLNLIVNGEEALSASDSGEPVGGSGTGIGAQVDPDAADASVTGGANALVTSYTVTDPTPGRGRSVKGDRADRASGEIVYEDPLTEAKPDEGFQEFDGEGGAFSFSKQGYEATPRGPGAVLLYTADSIDRAAAADPDSVPDTVDVQVDAAKDGKALADYGVVCGQIPGGQSAYFFGIDNSGFGVIARADDGQLRPLGAVPARIAGIKSKGKVNTVRARCDHANGRFTLIVNGREVLTIEDPDPLAKGSVGVYAESIIGNPPTITFTDFSAREG